MAPSNGEAVETGTKKASRRPRPAKLPEFKEPQNIYEAVGMVKGNAWTRFNETVEISVNLGLDPRKPNQSIKGTAKLPHGAGKTVRVGVFASGSDAQQATEAGADAVGGEDLVKRLQSGDIPFDAIIATPEMMPIVSRVGRILGPRGLMPNPKMGTVTKDVGKAIKAAKAGAVQFRVEKKGIVQAGIGKMNFTNEQLLDNIRSFMVAVSDCKPEGLKGKYILGVHLASTMGPSVKVDVASVDPTSARFMIDPKLIKSAN